MRRAVIGVTALTVLIAASTVAGCVPDTGELLGSSGSDDGGVVGGDGQAGPGNGATESSESPDPEPQPATDDAVAAALAEDETPSEAPVRRGPPLTGGEKDAFRLAVSRCWNVGSLSTAALSTTVVVGFEMEQSGKPVTSSIRMVSFAGGNDAGARQAFEAARRAIIRCGARGFDLPVEKYDQWREIEATFNPEGMQFR